MTKYYPRTLVLSNNSFSHSNSNGRALGSMFAGWPKDRLAQFAIMCIDPDFDVCDNYWQVTDAEVVRAVFRGESAVTGRAVKSSANVAAQRYGGGRSRKTALMMLLRNAAWRLGRWRGTKFKQWLDNFVPEVVVLQSGDSAFMLDIAQNIAHKRHIPLVIYNTEGYLFFDHNFMNRHWSDVVAFPLFKSGYRRAFRRTLATAVHCVYVNSKLERDYQKYMTHQSSFIYNSSALEFRPKDSLAEPPMISYLGNLGIRRPEALAEVGAVLQGISPELHINVYGNAKDADRDLLNAAPGVRYHGSVPYDEVINIIRRSDIIFHVEKNDPVLVRELRYAFSTKIADSICSGTDFVVYAPSNLACSQYVIETGAAWHADTPEKLRSVLLQILAPDNKRRLEVLENAKKAALSHNLERNAEKFREILASAIEKKQTE